MDILIIISAGNIGQELFLNQANVISSGYNNYPNDFKEEWANIKSPSESMNNITIGSCAGNFEFVFNSPGIALDEKFPTVYSTKYHYDFESEILSSKKTNKHLNKPDILYHGGDWDNMLGCSATGMTFLSAVTGQYFDKSTGTSFSAGLIGNIAAKILNQYPQLRMQTVKALIINSAKLPKLSTFFDDLSDKMRKRIIGKGIPEQEECLFSDSNSATIIIEDEIEPDKIKSYPINIPQYLLDKTSNNTVLDIKATLCYSFEPLLNNQLAYCPVHIGFGIFKNLDLDERGTNDEGREIGLGLNFNNSENIVIKNGQGWSEDYYFKAKLLSNVQTMDLIYNKENISENDNTFKIAINCKLHKLMNQIQKEHFNRSYKFSIVLNFKERPIKGLLNGSLYDELVAINTLDAIADLEAELNI